MDITSVKFSHLIETGELTDLEFFLSHTAFIISHKSECIETLLGVLWYLPANSPIIVVTNCPLDEGESLKASIKESMPYHKNVYVVHQKDSDIAQFFQRNGVYHILDHDGKVRDGKGEGMYIGTLCAILLGYPQWLIFYDADNLVPSALLEYTIAMGKLFMPTASNSSYYACQRGDILHNVRICWAAKPEAKDGHLNYKRLGRCTSVISPIFASLLDEWFGIPDYPVISSNAGEQGMTINTARTLRFSSGYSIETFQFVDFLFQAAGFVGPSRRAQVHQYLAQSAHFHTKGDDEHIKRMIAESLGGFFTFHEFLPQRVTKHLQQICEEMGLEPACPRIYPALQDVVSEGDEPFIQQYKLFEDQFELIASV